MKLSERVDELECEVKRLQIIFHSVNNKVNKLGIKLEEDSKIYKPRPGELWEVADEFGDIETVFVMFIDKTDLDGFCVLIWSESEQVIDWERLIKFKSRSTMTSAKYFGKSE